MFRRDSTIEQRIVPFQSGSTTGMRSELLLTWAAVLMVLLIGCVNIAGLLLARAGARGREIATRMALGGSRAAIVRQLLMESLLLALGGGAVGVGIGAFATDWLKRLGAKDFELWHPIELDARVLVAMLGIAALTSLFFGLAPALQTTRLDIRSVLMEAGRGVAGGAAPLVGKRAGGGRSGAEPGSAGRRGADVENAQLSRWAQSGLRHAQRHQRRGFVAGRPLQDQRRRQPAVHREPGAHPPHSRRRNRPRWR